MLQAYPLVEDFNDDEAAVLQLEWIKAFIMGIRRIRAERDIAPGKKLNVFIKGGTDEEKTWLADNTTYILSLARIENIKATQNELDDAVMALAGEMQLLVPLADIIDPAVESERLQKTITKLENEKAGLDKNLDNKNFVERAPENVVEGAKQRRADILTELKTYQDQLAAIEKLLEQ